MINVKPRNLTDLTQGIYLLSNWLIIKLLGVCFGSLFRSEGVQCLLVRVLFVYRWVDMLDEVPERHACIAIVTIEHRHLVVSF